jgi:hypothetical protein
MTLREAFIVTNALRIKSQFGRSLSKFGGSYEATRKVRIGAILLSKIIELTNNAADTLDYLSTKTGEITAQNRWIYWIYLATKMG